VSGQLVIVTPPAETQLATVAQVQADLPALSDAQAEARLDQASALIRQYCRGRLPLGVAEVRQTWRVARSCVDGGEPAPLYLRQWPVTAVDSVTEGGGALVEGTDYEITHQSLLWRLGGAHRRHWSGVVVAQYSGGYTLPATGDQADLAAACVALVTTLDAHAGEAADLRNVSIEGVGNRGFFRPDAGGGTIPASIRQALAGYRARVIA